MKPQTLQQLADHVSGTVIGDPNIVIESVSTLQTAGDGQITFLSNVKYLNDVKDTGASAVIIAQESEVEINQIVVQDPYYALQQIVVLIHGYRANKPVGIRDKSNISETATLGDGCHVHDFVTISDNVKVGKNCYFYPGVFIGQDTTIGDDCIFYPNAVVFNDCVIGDRVIVQSNTSIGEDGYGFSTHNGVHHKIPQIGRVILEDDVEIGASAGIERGTLDDTVIGKGTKIGDMVAIGHGTTIGPHCLLVAQVGVSGSTDIGHHCVFGGQVGIAGHLKIGDLTRVGAKSGISGNMEGGKSYLGTPAIDASKAKRSMVILQYLPEMKKRIKALERKLEKLSAGKS
ncbi:MAG: UDP-3-O-(3-hydroxymyristoyl)glucosamine N-acyltransferase [Planctomycetes bacterium]|nr:UDP-3-O-(3-hydroxymyristoyl)glucosamine N-acyltransferase [Planctomycetota bacterium]